MGDPALASTYQGWLAQGQASFEAELWTGSYYRIDTASADPAADRMSDQLDGGEWYARALGLPPIVHDPSHAASAFGKIHDARTTRSSPAGRAGSST